MKSASRQKPDLIKSLTFLLYETQWERSGHGGTGPLKISPQMDTDERIIRNKIRPTACFKAVSQSFESSKDVLKPSLVRVHRRPFAGVIGDFESGHLQVLSVCIGVHLPE